MSGAESGVNRLVRAAYTLGHLHPSQVAWRIRRIARSQVSPRPPLTGPHSLRTVGAGISIGDSPRDWSDGTRFRLLNQERILEGPARWQPDGASRLWLYHLHYFRWFHHVEPREKLRLILDWIDGNPAPLGPGWDPYTISLRVRVWTEWLVNEWPALTEQVRQTVLESIVLQGAVLCERLEFDIEGNHLLENSIALVWLGLRLCGPDSSSWLMRGLSLLREQCQLQVLEDGVHQERSPGYHAILLESLTQLGQVARSLPSNSAREVLSVIEPTALSMLGALANLSHPDGRVALLNDSGLDWTHPISRYARALGFPQGIPDSLLPVSHSSGYAVVRQDPIYLVVDGGPLGPDHQPGHGHADSLSFEMSVREHRVVTDTGVMTYDATDARAYDRGTSAHNTVEIDGQSQAELWGSFRCGRRPSEHRITKRESQGRTVVVASVSMPGCNGYGYDHTRRFVSEADRLTVTDSIVAEGRHVAVSRLHLAPEVVPACGTDARVVSLSLHGSTIAQLSAQHGGWRIVRSPYHPQMNLEIERHCVERFFEFSEMLSDEWSLILL